MKRLYSGMGGGGHDHDDDNDNNCGDALHLLLRGKEQPFIQ